jgi:hypothetical protein
MNLKAERKTFPHEKEFIYYSITCGFEKTLSEKKPGWQELKL